MTFNDKSPDYVEYIKQVNKLVTKDKLQKIIDKVLYINEMINYNANASLAFLSTFIYIGEDM